MAVNIRGLTRIKSQALVNFPPTPSLNLDFTTPYVNGLNPLPSTVTFSRADAGAYATHVGPDGLVRRAAHNIVLYSQQFNDANWSKASGTESATGDTMTAPDGTLTADTVTRSGTTFWHGVRQTRNVLSNTIYTYSCYVKSNTGEPGIIIAGGTVLDCTVYVSSAGLVSIKSQTGTSPIISYGGTNVGNGWWRLWMTFDTASLTTVGYGTADGSSVSNASNYFWGAQLEQNITPSYYVPTTSAAVYSTPRYDYDPVTLQPKGLLIEEARTNILLYSNDFANANWTKSAYTTYSSNVTTSPDGTTTADLIYPITTGSFRSVYQAPSPAAAIYTASVYVKYSGIRWIGIVSVLTGNHGVAWFDILNGTVGTVVAGNSASIQDVGNGWFKCIITFPSAVSFFQIFLADSDNSTNVTVNGTAGVYMWGAQMELGNFASSYIPTTSGSVTRARDDVLLTGTANTIASGAVGTMYIETTALKTRNSGLTDQILFGNAVKDQLYRSVNIGNTLYTYYFRSTIGTVNSADWTNPVKSIVAFDASSVSICLAGGAVASGSGSLAMTGNTYVGSDGTGAQFINGNVRQVLLYDFRMPDNKLPIITKG